MSPVLEIIPEAIFFQQTNLFCEISQDGLCYNFENEIEKKFHGLSVFHFSEGIDISEQIKIIFHQQPLLHKNYKKVHITYAVEESVLIPKEVYRSEKIDLCLNTIYGDLHDVTVATDFITEKETYNGYHIPASVHQELISQFPTATFSHHYSLLLKQKFPSIDFIKVVFYKNTFVALFVAKGELQVIHTYPYKSAADVVYHLLNICNQSKIEHAPLKISGMIEADSDLHREINYYFPDTNFDTLPAGYEYASGLKELPPHRYSHLFSYALCV